jgi:hypothetical protein
MNRRDNYGDSTVQITIMSNEVVDGTFFFLFRSVICLSRY